MTLEYRRSGAALFALAAFATLAGCERPTEDHAKLKAIRAEARSLESKHVTASPDGYAKLSKGQWPTAIASLQPYAVTVHHWGVDISIEPYFDGGWGYHIRRRGQELPLPIGCYADLGQGVFWHRPC